MDYHFGYEEIERLLEVFDFERADCVAIKYNLNNEEKYKALKQKYENRFFNSKIVPHLTIYNFELAETMYQSKRRFLSKASQEKFVAIKKDCVNWQIESIKASEIRKIKEELDDFKFDDADALVAEYGLDVHLPSFESKTYSQYRKECEILFITNLFENDIEPLLKSEVLKE